MTSLLDIGPLTEEISVGGRTVTVYGVTPEGFFYLLAKFPALQQLFTDSGSVTMDDMMAVAPASVAHSLAVATTPRGEYKTPAEWARAVERASEVALNLSAHHQMALFQAALNLTFPDGIGPFMEAVTNLAESLNRVSGKTVPVTKSSKPLRSGLSVDSRGMRVGRARPSASSTH